MSLSGEIKNKIIKDNARGEADTGSPEVQVAILTERISELTAHFEKHKNWQIGAHVFSPVPRSQLAPACS